MNARDEMVETVIVDIQDDDDIRDESAEWLQIVANANKAREENILERKARWDAIHPNWCFWCETWSLWGEWDICPDHD